MDDVHPLTRFRLAQDPPLSQEELAALLNRSRVTVTRWESGARKPEPEDLRVIQKVTGVHPAQVRPDLAELFMQPRRGPARPRSRSRSNAA